MGLVIGFLHELFARFGVPDSIVSDNATQVISKELKKFCKMFVVVRVRKYFLKSWHAIKEVIKSELVMYYIQSNCHYHPRSKDQEEQFVDTFKRSLKHPTVGPRRLHCKFLQVYRVILHRNAPSTMTLTEIMFAWKIRSVFDKLIPNKKKVEHTEQKTGYKFYGVGEKVFYQMYQMGKRCWEVGTVGRMIYFVKGPKMVHKSHLNQTKSRRERYSSGCWAYGSFF